MLWGTILSSAVFFCTIFGINQLLDLCNVIENDENGKTSLSIDLSDNTAEITEDDDPNREISILLNFEPWSCLNREFPNF